MRHRLYTTPEALPNEGIKLNRLLEQGLPWLHLRKPNYTLKELEALLQSIEVAYHPRLVLHQHWTLAEHYAVGGVHWTEWSRRQQEPADFAKAVAKQQAYGWQVGTAVHHPLTLDRLPHYIDYATVSPVFPSISKPHYHPNLDWHNTGKYPFTLIGLGGIDGPNLQLAYDRGFREVIFLGAIWSEPQRTLIRYKKLCQRLQQLDLMP